MIDDDDDDDDDDVVSVENLILSCLRGGVFIMASGFRGTASSWRHDGVIMAPSWHHHDFIMASSWLHHG